MQRDEVLDAVKLPDGKDLILSRWDGHIGISVEGRSLMSSHEHASEDELGRVVAARIAHLPAPKVLIGGLGLGYTLRAALDGLPPKAKVVVAELVPAVVRWNQGEHGALAGHPLADPRVRVVVSDVSKVIAKRTRYDAILLDVDNGPDALTVDANARLYKRAGLLRARTAIAPGGTLAVWSAFPSRTFTLWLKEAGFHVEQVRAQPSHPGGPRYYIWLASRNPRPRSAATPAKRSTARASRSRATSGRSTARAR